jgi:hypothetical protein
MALSNIAFKDRFIFIRFPEFSIFTSSKHNRDERRIKTTMNDYKHFQRWFYMMGWGF